MSDTFRRETHLSGRRGFSPPACSGVVFWFTGLSGSGKTTVACLSEKFFLKDGQHCLVIDGDNLRLGLSSDLGFSDDDRKENIRRAAHVAALFAKGGAVALVSLISPFEADRRSARKICESAGCAFVEVFVDTPISECIRRDVKGLYKKALSGEVESFTGITSAYEPPISPDITIKTVDCTAEQAAKSIADYFNMLCSLHEMTAFAADISVKAGEKIMEIYGGDFSVCQKGDESPLTEADTASNNLICAALESEYGEHAILSEESKDSGERLKSDGCFIVDPLDGTKEFIKRNGEFTVNIAFSYLGKSVMGVVFAPALNKLYYAAKGLGAHARTLSDLSDKTGGDFFGGGGRIRVSDKKSDLTVMMSRSHSDKKLEELLQKNKHKIGAEISAGSSLKGCLIAEGAADIYYRTGFTMEWDTAAMQCIVEEAGGVFLQGDGSPMVYNRKNSLNDKGFFILNSIENRFDE